jgi:pseudaminic acid synthase
VTDRGTTIKILDRPIGPGAPAYIVAEMSANHNQKYEQAVDIIRAAHAAGADAVKVQTYTADTLTIESDTPLFRVHGGLWNGQTLHELYNQAHTPWEWQPRLKSAAEELGLAFFSSPFDDSAVDFLEQMQVPAYKVASFELVDTALLQRVAQTGKPVIMSTGLATLSEIEEAVSTLRAAGAKEIALLKCTSAYPAPYDEMNLRTIPHLADTFQVPVGLSDHTLGITIPIAAVVLGACIVEKHFTLSRALGGPDSAFSLEPAELHALVEGVRNTEAALGEVNYTPTKHEQANTQFRRSLFVVKDMQAGETFSQTNLRSIRPGDGLSPSCLQHVLGQTASCDIARGTPLKWDMIHSDKADG